MTEFVRLDEAFSAVAQAGYRFHGLYEDPREGHLRWHCRLHCKDTILYGLGEGNTPEQAIADAIEDAKKNDAWRPKKLPHKESRITPTLSSFLEGLQ